MDSTLKIANCLRAAATDVGLKPPSVAVAKNIIGLGLHECMQILFPRASGAQHRELIERYKYHFVTEDKTVQALFDGVTEGLAALESAGALLAVATGKSRVGLERAFATVDIGHHFVTTRCADETRTKPHPQMVHEILDFTAIDATKAIMVGDTSYDIDMAANAGISGLGVSYGAHTERTLKSSGAISVHDRVEDMFTWLLDGRVGQAFSD